jgi:hypothetical protein
MTSGPPSKPNRNDVWIDDAGGMKYFNGSEWVPYEELPDIDLEPWLLEKGAAEEE